MCQTTVKSDNVVAGKSPPPARKPHTGQAATSSRPESSAQHSIAQHSVAQHGKITPMDPPKSIKQLAGEAHNYEFSHDVSPKLYLGTAMSLCRHVCGCINPRGGPQWDVNQ